MKRCVWLVFVVPILLAADDGPWAWYDQRGQKRTCEELEEILQSHKVWVRHQQEGKFGHQQEGELADFDRARLLGADLRGAQLTGAHFTTANLTGAQLTGANITDGYLGKADLTAASLSGANFRGAQLKGAQLMGADLRGTNYEPADNAAPELIAYAKGLGYLTWKTNSAPIYALRKLLIEAGFSDPARQVTAAIHRHNQNGLELVVFDWTCEWGANWLRPLVLVGALSVACSVIYWIGMHSGKRSGLYLAATGQRITTSKGKERVIRIGVQRLRQGASEQRPKTPAWSFRSFRRRLGREFTALRTAFLFSLMSVFNIGFREFNFGRWIRMLQPREFDIRARGWMRTVSGIQSLVGIALVALSLLSYFGHPFE